ncbi:MAG: hypothetical protein B7Z22_12255 [Hyphomonas sp. 32-62-5]|nr:MAG: hypothetical protein B7Z22_12255 [Hyphomonas sp. 32-62-5]
MEFRCRTQAPARPSRVEEGPRSEPAEEASGFALSGPFAVGHDIDEPSAPSIRHECTASIGVAVFRGRDESQNAVIDRADAAMYRAKEEGRNRIQCAPGPAAAG